MSNKGWSSYYLQKQHEAIIWLLEQGVDLCQIRELRWGKVDECSKTISVVSEVVILQYDMEKKLLRRDSYEREFKLDLKGTRCEWFFLKSKIYCPWVFTREQPNTWRREGSKNYLYSLSDIQRICGKILIDKDTTILTNPDIFTNIEVSKLNITKMKTKELEEEAIVV